MLEKAADRRLAGGERIEQIQDIDIGLSDEICVIVRSLSAAKFQETPFFSFVRSVLSKRSQQTLNDINQYQH